MLGVPEVAETAKMIAEFGILIVSAAVLILFSITMFLMIKNQNKHLLEKILQQGEVVDLKKEKLTQERVTNHLNTRHNVNMQVNVIIQKLLQDTSADVVMVVEFHNGEYNLGGLPLAKMTQTFETVMPYVKSSAHDIKSLGTGLFPSLMKSLFSDGKMIVSDIEEIKDSAQALYQTLTLQNVTSFYFQAIHDIHSRLIGFLGVCYCGNHKSNLQDEELIKNIHRSSSVLDGLLSITFSENSNIKKEGINE